MKNLLTTILLLTVALTAAADDIKMCASGNCVVGISATTGNMTIIKKSPQNTVEGIAIMENSTKRNNTPTVARFDSQERLTSISRLGYTSFDYQGNKPSATTTSPFGTTQYQTVEVSKTSSVSFSGLIGWADNMLAKFSSTYGDKIETTLKVIDKVTDIRQFFNSSLEEQARMNAREAVEGTMLGDAIEMYEDVNDWMDWVKGATGSGLFVGKQLLNTLAKYTEYRDKWAETVYNVLITIDNRRKEESKKKLGSAIANEELRKLLTPPDTNTEQTGTGDHKNMGGGNPPAQTQTPPPPDNQLNNDGNDGNNDDNGGGNADKDNPYPPLNTLGVINISKKNLLDRLTDEELAQVRAYFANRELGDAMVNGCKTWMENLDTLKATASEECQSALRALTYDDLMEYDCSVLEMMAIAMVESVQIYNQMLGGKRQKSKLYDIVGQSVAIKPEGLRLFDAGETDDVVKRRLKQYVSQLPMARTVTKYKLEKYVFD